MRFLIDASLSFRVAKALQKAGHDAVHVRDALTVDASDIPIFHHAANDDRIVDVGAHDDGPSDQSTLLLTQIPAVADDLTRGDRRDRGGSCARAIPAGR